VRAVAVAHPNIALSKYWGKRDGDGNVPAVPSLSITLDALSTRTEVTFDPSLDRDVFVLNGCESDAVRVTELLDRVRIDARTKHFARVVSANDFPTASGLASSASGFAALALAAVHAAGLDRTTAEIADLARRSSASAARSLFGGYVELDGPDARQVAPADHLDLAVLVCVTTEAEKPVSSRDGMAETACKSPYWRAWLETAPRIHARLRAALLARDIPRVGELAEQSALAMHASALAAGIVYVSGATLHTFAEARALRREGIGAWATFDAGPHLKCITAGADLRRVKARLSAVDGVLRVIEARAGDGAHILEGAAR
jgi:diphosphomevalonate decarboxylase